MIPKLAIEKAISGGWKTEVSPQDYRLPVGYAQIALDPTFWRALGKACGWADKWSDGTPRRTWLHKAFAFTEVVLLENDTEQFWKEILGKKTI